MIPLTLEGWKGQTAVIVASGPSAIQHDYEAARGKARVVAINNSWSLVPWCDAVYACDFSWWKRYNFLKEYTGLKLCGDMRAKHEGVGIEAVTVLNGDDRLHFETPGTVGRGGGSGGFQVLNLLLQAGVRKVALCGFDCSVDEGYHWHGRHPAGMANPNENNTRMWARALDNAAVTIAAKGVDVINCSLRSAVTAFPKMSLAGALQC